MDDTQTLNEVNALRRRMERLESQVVRALAEIDDILTDANGDALSDANGDILYE